MKLYRKADGEIVGTQALAGKTYTPMDIPVDKQGLIAWLNDNLRIVPQSTPFADSVEGNPYDPVEEHDLHQVHAHRDKYTSPLDARSTIAGIDAGMCASAIRQMTGANLARVVSASIERMAELSDEGYANEDLLS